MPQFEAIVRVIHVETWIVEAKDKSEAMRKFAALTEDVEDDETGGEVVDWEVQSVKDAPL